MNIIIKLVIIKIFLLLFFEEFSIILKTRNHYFSTYAINSVTLYTFKCCTDINYSQKLLNFHYLSMFIQSYVYFPALFISSMSSYGVEIIIVISLRDEI